MAQFVYRQQRNDIKVDVLFEGHEMADSRVVPYMLPTFLAMHGNDSPQCREVSASLEADLNVSSA